MSLSYTGECDLCIPFLQLNETNVYSQNGECLACSTLKALFDVSLCEYIRRSITSVTVTVVTENIKTLKSNVPGKFLNL